MSQMYAIFEEVVGPQPNTVHGDIHGESIALKVQKENCKPSEIMTSSNSTPPEKPAQNPHEDTEESSKQSSVYGSCAGSPGVDRSKMNNSKHTHRHHYGSRRHASTLPHPRKQKETKFVCKSSSNPLLDTISVLTYDPCDSDDYCDLSSVYDQRRILSSSEEKNRATDSVSAHPVEGDRESIGYAGSNSIDSGYKSFCPTPEIPDPSIYATEVSRVPTSSANTYSFYTDSSSSNSSRGLDSGKPKVTMGTKTMSRQGQVSGSREVGSRMSDSSLYEVNLDHLMYLRQSLLSAIQKCESSKSRDDESAYGDSIQTSSTKASRNSQNYKSRNIEQCASTKAHPAERQLTDNYASSSTTSSTTSSISSVPTYQKTVRFNTDVKVSLLSNTTKTNCEGADGIVNSTNQSSTTNSSSNRRKDKNLYPGSRFHSKSILKDPLCANLRSQLEAEAPDCTLEEEIDSLLYGRAEFYDLESVDDFPCSYVTMIEEKYRSGKPSLAKVRKLKGGKTQDATKAETESSIENPTEDTESDSQSHGKDSSSITKSLSSVAKSRFTEVARCMLEIIEDLQLKKLQQDTGKTTKETSNSQAPLSRTIPTIADIKDGDMSESSKFDVQPLDDVSVTSSSKCNDSTTGYASAVEYHVYEEIAYDFVGNPGDWHACLDMKSEVPPPLPARPTSMLQKKEHLQPLRANFTSVSGLPPAPQPPSRKGRCSRRSAEEGSVRNRPKQRSNLYSLFADQAERRNISRSLEREWRVVAKDEHTDPEDEYGFRKVFPSI